MHSFGDWPTLTNFYHNWNYRCVQQYLQKPKLLLEHCLLQSYIQKVMPKTTETSARTMSTTT